MKARIKGTGEVLNVIEVDSERVLVKYGSDAKSFRIHEVDLIPERCGFNKEIDWEQRRYELAKEAIVGLMHDSLREDAMCHPRTTAERCVILIDALVSKLRESQVTDKFSSIVEQAPNLHKALEEIVSLPIPEPMTWKAFSDRVRDIALSAIGKCK